MRTVLLLLAFDPTGMWVSQTDAYVLTFEKTARGWRTECRTDVQLWKGVATEQSPGVYVDYTRYNERNYLDRYTYIVTRDGDLFLNGSGLTFKRRQK